MLNEGTARWTRVTERDVVEWFKERQEMTRDEFEGCFGKFGGSLPPIPGACSNFWKNGCKKSKELI